MAKKNNEMIKVQGTEVAILSKENSDYVCLTDMAKSRNPDATGYVISRWLSARYTIEFIGIWESVYNNGFNVVEFNNIKTESGTRGYVLTSKQWIERTGAIGIISKAGRYGGTYAHKDIAFEFAAWLSAEFKFYLILEYQRLKTAENKQQSLEWDLSRALAKINYKIHTDAVKEHLIPPELTEEQINIVYASEADVLNMALFGQTASEWRKLHPQKAKTGNIRDSALLEHLIVLSNLESINAMLISDKLAQSERLVKLNNIAIRQMLSLVNDERIQGVANKQLLSN
jgi:hypothetical protein